MRWQFCLPGRKTLNLGQGIWSEAPRRITIMQSIDDILAILTPEHLRKVILQTAEQQQVGVRAGVDTSTLIARLTEGCDLGTGTERSQNYRKFVEAIQANVAQIEGMKYIKSSD
jgi:hypothetical protein